VSSGAGCLAAWSRQVRLVKGFTLLVGLVKLGMVLAHLYIVNRPSPALATSMAHSMHKYGENLGLF